MRPILFDFFVYLVRHRFLTQAILAVFAMEISVIENLLPAVNDRGVPDPPIIDTESHRLLVSLIRRVGYSAYC
jgi:hypothetical protein